MICVAQIQALLVIAHAYLPSVEVPLFGSQARGDLRSWSDVAIATWAGFSCVALVAGGYRRHIVGWRVSRTLEADLPLEQTCAA